MSAPRALVTGFEPFRQWRVNSSGEGARRLAAEGAAAARVLPVDHEAAEAALVGALAVSRPDILLLTGLADRPAPQLELYARRPAHHAEGPARLTGLWPWAAALGAMRAAGVAAELSRDAGRYVCETSYWSALAVGGPRLIAFLHVPPLSEAWPEARVAAAMRVCLAAAQAVPAAQRNHG